MMKKLLLCVNWYYRVTCWWESTITGSVQWWASFWRHDDDDGDIDLIVVIFFWFNYLLIALMKVYDTIRYWLLLITMAVFCYTQK